MIINRIKLTSSVHGDILDLPFKSPTVNDQFYIKHAVGLDLTGTAVGYIGADQVLGNLLQVTAPARSVKLLVGLGPVGRNHPQDLRNYLYKAVSLSRQPTLTLGFYSDSTMVCFTLAYITSIESEQFSSSKDVTVGLQCIDGFLSAPNLTSLPNPLATEYFDLSLTEGNAPTAMNYEVLFNAATTFWGIESIYAGGSFAVDYNFVPGDRLSILGDPNKPSVLHISSAGVEKPMSELVRNNSVWAYLFPGPNRFYQLSGHTNSIIRNITYTAKFWGI